jgi:prevent-host-death family protein
MPTEIGAYEAKTRLPALLQRVARGETFTITRHGRPIARPAPIDRAGPDRRREAIEPLKRFADRHTLDVPVKELINEGRRSGTLRSASTCCGPPDLARRTAAEAGIIGLGRPGAVADGYNTAIEMPIMRAAARRRSS